MNTFNIDDTTKKKFLLIPAMPTPNGRLHLGHIGGPFLKMDILARTFNREGHHARVMSGSDVYESFVLLKAHQTGKSPKEVCNEFHQLIKEDLAAIMIDCEYYNPFDEEFHAKVDAAYKDTLDVLVASGSAIQRSEKFMYCPSAKKYIAGTWLKGDCPHCHTGAGSYLCEGCGMQFNPEDIEFVQSTTGEEDLEARQVNSRFLKITKTKELLQHIEQFGARPEFIDIVKKYLGIYKGEVRLTNPGNWGVRYGDEILEDGNFNVVFPYTGLFSLSRVCGELFAKEFELDKNPFDKGSEVITIASFGIDSTVPWFVGVLGSAIESGAFKAFDYLLTNHFYQLEGSKFSTSRLHVIWSGDIVNKTKATSDAVRYYLMKNHPESAEDNFDINEFISFNNDFLVMELEREIKRLWDILQTENIESIPQSLVEKLRAIRQEQLSISLDSKSMRAWTQATEDGIRTILQEATWKEHSYWVLKSIALIAYPIMPNMGIQLWQALGHSGQPTVEAFSNITSIGETTVLNDFFERLSFEDLLPCLPKTLNTSSLNS